MVEQMNLVQKLASIRREVKNIEKQGENKFQGYKYLRAEDIAGEMGDRLAAMNVIVARRNLNFVQDNITIRKENGDERTDVHVIVTLDYVFVDGDALTRQLEPNETAATELSIASIGEGRDSGDKAVAKAMTNALKYALTQPLMMRVGDDPEADSEHDKPEKRKPVDNHNARITENKFIDNGRGDREVLASEEDRKRLVGKAKQLMGEKEGRAWVKQRTTDLGIKSEKDFQLHQFMMLMNELEALESGEHVEPIEEESDIPF